MAITKLTVANRDGRSSFDVPADAGITLLDALLYIQEFLDTSVSFHWNCRTAQCGVCTMLLDGSPVLACITRLEPDKAYEVRAIDEANVVQGLVCDVTERYLSFFRETAERGSERRKKSSFESLLFPRRPGS